MEKKILHYVIVHEFKGDWETKMDEIRTLAKGRRLRKNGGGWVPRTGVHDYSFRTSNKSKALEYVNACNKHFGKRVTTYAYGQTFIREDGVTMESGFKPMTLTRVPKDFQEYLDNQHFIDED